MERLAKEIGHQLSKFKRKFITPRLIKNKTKFFCIGRNKTGTTSLKQAFVNLGFVVGDQRAAELLLPEFLSGNYKNILNYCHSAQVFQDIPFSLPDMYKILVKEFPNSKYILTVRDSPEQWYNSLTKFHSKIIGFGNIPTEEQLKESEYAYKGFMWDAQKAMCELLKGSPYDKETLIAGYEKYNKGVIDFFLDKPEDLLVINLSDKQSYKKLIKFIGVSSDLDDFPWENKTSKIKQR